MALEMRLEVAFSSRAEQAEGKTEGKKGRSNEHGLKKQFSGAKALLILLGLYGG
jgi:hypothetical protein